jgi:hypothetical protein
VRYLKGQVCMEPREKMDNEQVYAIAKDAVVYVNNIDSEFHHIRRSKLQREQNVAVLSFRSKKGPMLVIKTTQDVQAGEELCLPPNPRKEDDGTNRDPRDDGHEKYPKSPSIISITGSSEESAESSDDLDRHPDNAGDVTDDDVLVELRHEQNGKERRLSAMVENNITQDTDEEVLHDVIESFLNGNRFSTEDVANEYRRNKKQIPDKESLNEYLVQFPCCIGNDRPQVHYNWVHDPEKCRKPRDELFIHYSLCEKGSITIRGISNLCDVKKHIVRKLELSSCCTLQKDATPHYYKHDMEKCTTQTIKIPSKYKIRVAAFQERPIKAVVRWTADMEETFLRLRGRGVEFGPLVKHLKTKYPGVPFTVISFDTKIRRLKEEKKCGNISDKKKLRLIKGVTNPLSRRDLIKKAQNNVTESTHENLKSWIEKYHDGIECKIDFSIRRRSNRS